MFNDIYFSVLEIKPRVDDSRRAQPPRRSKDIGINYNLT